MELLATLLIEAVVLTIYGTWKRLDLPRLLIFSFILNCATQPLFSLWLRNVLEGQDYLWWDYFIKGEVIVFLGEACAYAIFYKEKRNRFALGLTLSLMANAASAAATFIVF
ncbi:MAG: hypothetical protein WAO98_09375 [Alphaproteobacteria bacterium]